MFKHSKNSDQINPWTFRHRDASRDFNDASPAAYKPIKSLREKLNFVKRNAATHNEPSRNITDLFLNNIIHEQESRVIHDPNPKFSNENEALAQIQKTFAGYKVINFEYRRRPAKKIEKTKKTSSYVSNSMRQYTEGMEIAPRKEGKPSSEYEKILKVRRYFTEQKDYEDYSQEKETRRLDLTEISKTEQIRKPFSHTIKIVKTSKNNSREEVVTSGKLFDKIQDLCDRKGMSGGGHLSIMKRNYNIKKLEKLINHDKL